MPLKLWEYKRVNKLLKRISEVSEMEARQWIEKLESIAKSLGVAEEKKEQKQESVAIDFDTLVKAIKEAIKQAKKEVS